MSQLPPCSRGGTVRAPSACDLVLAAAPFSLPHVRGRRERRLGERRHAFGSWRAAPLALVPLVEQLGDGRQPIRPGWVSPAKFDARHVARIRVEAVEIPDRLVRASGKWSARKPPPLFLAKMPVKPTRLPAGADVEQIDHQQIARLGAFDPDRARSGSARSSDRCRAHRRRSRRS